MWTFPVALTPAISERMNVNVEGLKYIYTVEKDKVAFFQFKSAEQAKKADQGLWNSQQLLKVLPYRERIPFDVDQACVVGYKINTIWPGDSPINNVVELIKRVTPSMPSGAKPRTIAIINLEPNQTAARK